MNCNYIYIPRASIEHYYLLEVFLRSILGKVFEKKKCSRYTHLTIPPINHGLLLDLFMMVSLIRGFGVIATSIPSCLLNPGLCSGNQKHSPMHNTELVVFLLANHSVASWTKCRKSGSMVAPSEKHLPLARDPVV